MAFTFQSVGSMTAASNTNTTPHNVPFPSGITAGDLLLLVWRINSTTIGTGPDNGFTLLKRTNSVLTELWGKIASGSESGNIAVTGGANPQALGQCARFSGSQASITGIVHANNHLAGTSAATQIAHQAITVTENNTLIIVAGGASGNVTTSYANANNGGAFTEIGHGQSAGLQSLCWNYWIQSSAANVADDNFTFASTGSRSALIVSLLSDGVTTGQPSAKRMSGIPGLRVGGSSFGQGW